MDTETDLNKSKIININDFIFRQNLDFYPNLRGIVVQDNILYYEENGQITSESLTFDLRTLPGNIWNYNPNDFIKAIRKNKSCKELFEFIKLLNQNTFNNNINYKDKLENDIIYYMNLYFNLKENFQDLSEDNKILIGNVENLITTIPRETFAGQIVNKRLDDYLTLTKTLGDENGKKMALVLKNKNLPSLIEVDEKPKFNKAGFINAAILIYGMVNIALILAISIMK